MLSTETQLLQKRKQILVHANWKIMHFNDQHNLLPHIGKLASRVNREVGIRN